MAIFLSGSFAGLLKSVLLTAVALLSLARHRRALHMLQLDSYSNARFARWLAADPLHRLLDLRSIALAAVVLLARILLARFRQDAADTIVLAVFAIGLAAIAAATPGKAAMKKPLVWTQRAVRIFVTSEIISVLLAAMCIFPALGVTSGIGPVALAIIGSLIVVQLAGSITIAANIVLAPVQHAINRAYLRRAEQKLKKLGPKVIGITGSYGKTSTKFYLQTLLSGRFNALKTPQSFNTLMGICRVINDELKPEHEVFVAEMGAYRPGDIKELAELVHPSIGILTAIGPQHLERFGSIEAIEKTKYELIQSLPDSGTAIFNNDDERCRRLADGTTRLKVIRYGVRRDDPRLNVWAEDLSPGPKGTSFTLADDSGAKAPTTAKVLGSHNIQNVLGAAAAALEMGMSLKEIARRIPLIAPAPHRLELIESPGGITVIDDSYNSNPVGALAALEVLRQFPGKHVLVTPGMVELGDSSRTENQKLGAAAARLCDYVILVDGGPKDAIIEGLVAADFNRANLFVAPDLKSARSKLEGIVAAGDTVLFENDLPDLYTSASPA